MIQRCEYPKARDYARYGGRGIRVCARWRGSFAAFTEDMGERPPGMQLDRIDNDGNYEPGNVRWATVAEQSANKSTNRKLTIGGVTLTVTEWARSRGLDPFTVFRRVYRGWSAERAVMTPVERHGQLGRAVIEEAFGEDSP